MITGHQRRPPWRSMPARCVAFARSLCAVSTWRTAGRSARSSASTRSKWSVTQLRVGVRLVRQRLRHQVGQAELLVGLDERPDAGRVDEEPVEGVAGVDVALDVAEPAVAHV